VGTTSHEEDFHVSKWNIAGRRLAGLAMIAAISWQPAANGQDRSRGAAITLEEARTRALEANPDLQAGAARVRALEGALSQSRALPNPELSFEAEDFGGNLPAESLSQRTLSLSERVEWFGKRSARVEAARLERDVAALDLERRRLDVRQEVDRRFAALLVSQQRLGIAKENAATASEVRAAVSALASAGEVSPIEETRALGDEALAEIERDGAARDVTLSARSLSQLWGEASGSVLYADGRLASSAAAPDREAAFAQVARLPDLTRWDVETARLAALETLARRQAVPDFTLSAGTRSFAGTGQRTWVAGLSLPIPLLTTYSGARSEAAARLEQARAERRADEVRLRAAYLTSEEGLLHAAREVRLLNERVVPNARQVYDALNEGYRRGKFRLLDLLEARRALATARLRLVDAISRLNLALADMSRLTGEGLLTENRGTR
jgi:cobalt-zinc-cadmium efflux system outer membrane protein